MCEVEIHVSKSQPNQSQNSDIGVRARHRAQNLILYLKNDFWKIFVNHRSEIFFTAPQTWQANPPFHFTYKSLTKWEGKSVPTSSKMDFLYFSDFRRDVYRAHGRHSGSSAMPLAEVIHEIRLKNKILFFFEKLYFFDETYFSKDCWKIENFKKSTFSIFFWKIENFKKSTSHVFSFFQQFSKKVTF